MKYLHQYQDSNFRYRDYDLNAPNEVQRPNSILVKNWTEEETQSDYQNQYFDSVADYFQKLFKFGSGWGRMFFR